MYLNNFQKLYIPMYVNKIAYISYKEVKILKSLKSKLKTVAYES